MYLEFNEISLKLEYGFLPFYHCRFLQKFLFFCN
ncbi:unnamed protein product [Brugia timori]|uniref:Uncharacterized protein n=1 Tax=Brugia timori TaxID=42155 RepID=A0A3P7STV6_9BILA|nr:unnamed protein product [Brugia timori]